MGCLFYLGGGDSDIHPDSFAGSLDDKTPEGCTTVRLSAAGLNSRSDGVVPLMQVPPLPLHITITQSVSGESKSAPVHQRMFSTGLVDLVGLLVGLLVDRKSVV